MRDPMSAVDEIINRAQKEGKFEDLRGKGKPLVIDTSPDAVIKGILKEANVSVAPEWITLAREIDQLFEQEQQLLQTYAAAAEAEQETLLGGGGPLAAALTAPEQPATNKARRPGWPTLVAPFSRKQTSAPVQKLQDDQALVGFQHRWDQTLERYAALLHDLNRKIRRFNQIVPLAHRQRAPLPVRERLDAFTDRFPCLARSADETVDPERGQVPASLLSPPPEAEGGVTRKRDVLQAAALQRMRRGDRKPPPIG